MLTSWLPKSVGPPVEVIVSVPVPSAVLLSAKSSPFASVVPPLYELPPPKVCVPVPVFTIASALTPPGPSLITPLKIASKLFTPRVSTAGAAPSFCTNAPASPESEPTELENPPRSSVPLTK